MSELNIKQKFVKQNFEYHARMAAHAFATKHQCGERQMDVLYQAIMAFTDSAFEKGKIEIKERGDWDEQEENFRKAMTDEAIRQGNWESIGGFN